MANLTALKVKNLKEPGRHGGRSRALSGGPAHRFEIVGTACGCGRGVAAIWDWAATPLYPS